MVEIINNLFVGNKHDFYFLEDDVKFSFCLCAKTFHKKFAKLKGETQIGYIGNMSKDEPEYLIAIRPELDVLAVNLIDVDDIKYQSKQIIDKCLNFIETQLKGANRKVLIACDQGQSRSAGVAFIYLMQKNIFENCKTYEEAYLEFKKIYPYEEMKNGIKQHTMNYWEELQNGKKKGSF